MEERLQKILASYGIASRRAAEKLIEERKVRVNGNTAVLGDLADASCDVIEVDGVRLQKKQPKRVYLMLNKPRGYVTTMQDEKGRRSVSALIADCPERVYPVGRLDMYSEGLLLFTNDGALANRMMHPSGMAEKTYLVWVNGYREGAEDQLSAPIEIDGRSTSPAKVQLLHKEHQTALFEMKISEGRNRQLRRLCQRAELTVTRLKRIGEGSLSLGDLKVGAWRYLSDEEVESLFA